MSIVNTYVCPVCGYGMRYPARDFHICPSCGTEFGYDDAGRTHEELRDVWLRNGPRWWSPVDPQPPNWDPYRQLESLFFSSLGFPQSSATWSNRRLGTDPTRLNLSAPQIPSQ